MLNLSFAFPHSADPPLADERVSHVLSDRPEVSAQRALVDVLGTHNRTQDPEDPETAPDWSEQSIVKLHWVLLQELSKLQDPEAPLEEKLDTLAWALTDPGLDERPFSFANCLRVVGTSPLSPTPYFGRLKVDEIRHWIAINARKWINATIARYPGWVQQLIREQPDLTVRRLSANPQWLNEQIRAHDESGQADLFSEPRFTRAN